MGCPQPMKLTNTQHICLALTGATQQSDRVKSSLLVRLKRAPVVLAIIVALACLHAICAAPLDVPFLLEFLAGDYRLVGQQPDSGTPYVGKVSFRERKGQFEIIRTVGGTTIHGTGIITTGGEGTAVLRCRFTVTKVAYEATYLWRSDMDNYPRLTGYVYHKQGETKSPGLEALFHIPPTPEK